MTSPDSKYLDKFKDTETNARSDEVSNFSLEWVKDDQESVCQESQSALETMSTWSRQANYEQLPSRYLQGGERSPQTPESEDDVDELTQLDQQITNVHSVNTSHDVEKDMVASTISNTCLSINDGPSPRPHSPLKGYPSTHAQDYIQDCETQTVDTLDQTHGARKRPRQSSRELPSSSTSQQVIDLVLDEAEPCPSTSPTATVSANTDSANDKCDASENNGFKCSKTDWKRGQKVEHRPPECTSSYKRNRKRKQAALKEIGDRDDLLGVREETLRSDMTCNSPETDFRNTSNMTESGGGKSLSGDEVKAGQQSAGDTESSASKSSGEQFGQTTYEIASLQDGEERTHFALEQEVASTCSETSSRSLTIKREIEDTLNGIQQPQIHLCASGLLECKVFTLTLAKHYGVTRMHGIGVVEPWNRAQVSLGTFKTRGEALAARETWLQSLERCADGEGEAVDANGNKVDIFVQESWLFVKDAPLTKEDCKLAFPRK
mmetsp:Transcript_4139/g.7909  ORF Transcript_4139/g.7909 Transcript_4139/m.7909 type:complete len:492 (+) Transcript_4139:237-1712(+)